MNKVAIDTFKKFMKDESLWSEPYNLDKKYYGIYQGKTSGKDKEDLDNKLEPLMEILKTVIPSITMFCSFVKGGKGIDSIRYLCKYDSESNFIGVTYITIDNFIKKL